jgi:hypothetical protein
MVQCFKWRDIRLVAMGTHRCIEEQGGLPIARGASPSVGLHATQGGQIAFCFGGKVLDLGHLCHRGWFLFIGLLALGVPIMAAGRPRSRGIATAVLTLQRASPGSSYINWRWVQILGDFLRIRERPSLLPEKSRAVRKIPRQSIWW